MKFSKHKKNSSTKLHASRTRIMPSKLARKREVNRKFYATARYTILAIIVITMLLVTLSALLKLFSNPERIVKQKIEAITTDYYENYFYPQLTAENEIQNSTNLAKNMERYTTVGFSIVTLRQLLLLDGMRYAEATDILTTYCDENKTYIQIFPEPPFEKTNYHVDYHYSCEF